MRKTPHQPNFLQLRLFSKWVQVTMRDRLTHRVHILEANGSSYRLQDAKKRIKSRSAGGS